MNELIQDITKALDRPLFSPYPDEYAWRVRDEIRFDFRQASFALASVCIALAASIDTIDWTAML